jgi:DNA-binding response OmpR family regulator
VAVFKVCSGFTGDNGCVRILLVEDDALLSGSLVRGLAADGYAVEVARDGIDGLHLARENAYDAMILDVLLPGLNGYRVCAALRADGAELPVLMLTAKDGTWDVANGLDTGADDYLVKPFQYPVLLARLRALLRRGPARLPPILVHGRLSMDPARHRCTLEGADLELTPREFALLRYLLSYPALTHTRWDLLEHVWGENEAADFNVVQVYVSALRRKIDQPGQASLIETVRGVGYRLADVS